MANQKHLDILKQGVKVWNKWREKRQSSWTATPYLPFEDLSDADLSGADLSGADLVRADLSNANLTGADLTGADLVQADLQGAHFYEANLAKTNFTEANFLATDLTRANLVQASLQRTRLYETNLTEADLTDADLTCASLIDTNLTNAILTGCQVFGISAWNLNLEGAVQKDLVINDYNSPKITVDNLEVAQFMYLLLNNHKIRDVINTITSKVILILGRFNDERKPILNALRDELRKHNYSPVVFDFEKPGSRNLTETVSTLAHLSRFIIADLTDAKSIPQELERIIPRLRVPVQSLLHVSEKYAYAMYRDFEDYHWVLPIYHYDDQNALLRSLQTHIIDPAEQKAQELEKRK